MRKVLITGAGGFIGGYLTMLLSSKGYFVRVADLKYDEYRPLPFRSKYNIDLRYYGSCLKVCDNMDDVYHLAADMGGIGYISEYNASLMDNNIRIDSNMLRAAREKKVKRFFYSSSACVYPIELQNSSVIHALKESDIYPAHPDSAYGWEKLFMEQLMQSYMKDYGMDIKIARFHNIYGPYGSYHDEREKAPAALCYKVATQEKEIEIWGDGSQVRSFLYAEDCVDAVYRLMQSKSHGPMNIGTDEWITVDNLARLIMRIAGKHLEIKHDITKPQGVLARNADITMAEIFLDWTPTTSLDDGMTRLYRWILERIDSERGNKK